MPVDESNPLLMEKIDQGKLKKKADALNDIEAQYRSQELNRLIRLAEQESGAKLDLFCTHQTNYRYGPVIINSNNIELRFKNPDDVVITETELTRLKEIEGYIKQLIEFHSNNGGVPMNYDRTRTSLEDNREDINS